MNALDGIGLVLILIILATIVQDIYEGDWNGAAWKTGIGAIWCFLTFVLPRLISG